jgi:hypothetical protein
MASPATLSDQDYGYLLPDATFGVRRNSSQGVTITSQGFEFWSLTFVAPGRLPLIPGAYENARRYLLQPPDAPGLEVSGTGRACSTLTGRFDVLDASYLPGGDVESFAADFVQHCEGLAPALFGSIRFNSNLQQFSVSNAVIDTVNSTAVFTVTMNPPPDVLVSVNFRTVDGTAVAAIDYVATSQTITFAIGEDEQTVTVPLINPSPLEAKNFFSQLSAPSGAAIWIARGSANLVPAEQRSVTQLTSCLAGLRLTRDSVPKSPQRLSARAGSLRFKARVGS